MTIYFGDGTSVSTAPSGGAFSSYAILQHRVSAGSHGGSADTSWTTRTLNHEEADPDGIVSLSSNEFTLGAGNYLIRFGGSGWDLDYDMQCRIYDVTNSAMRIESSPGTGPGAHDGNGWAYGVGRVTPSGSTAYRLEQRSDNDRGTWGHGEAINRGTYEIFAIVEIFKEG